MSNETGTMKKSISTLTPKRRFPEFRDKPEWEEVPLKQIAKRSTTKNLDGSITRVLTNSAEHGVVDQRDYFDKDIATAANIGGYYIVDQGDFVYNPRISTFAPVGPISRNNIGKGVMSPLYTVFQFKDESTDFYQYYFKSSSWHSYLRRVSSMGARHDRMSITTGDFMAMPVPMPSVPEQNKIADCLTSLDELTTAEERKLEALRDHKSGLMQRLFPQPGETQPRLRFPEFRDKGEWGNSALGKLLSRKPEYGVNAAAVPFSDDLPTYIRITDIDDNGQFVQAGRMSVDIKATEENYLVEGDIVLARTGASVGKSYQYRKKDGRLIFAGFLIRVRPNPQKLISAYLSNYMSTWRYWDWVRVNSVRGGQPGINSSEYASMLVPLPPAGPKCNELAEQQMIADCFTTLDNQITAQAEKIETLKQHKRGLMQQLFPAPGGQ